MPTVTQRNNVKKVSSPSNVNKVNYWTGQPVPTKVSSPSNVKRVNYWTGQPVPTESYLHHQQEPSGVWVVNHNLGSVTVEVVVYTEDWEEMDAGVVIIDQNTLHILCNPPLSGYAVVRK